MAFLVKFRYSEKTTKIRKNFPLLFWRHLVISKKGERFFWNFEAVVSELFLKNSLCLEKKSYIPNHFLQFYIFQFGTLLNGSCTWNWFSRIFTFDCFRQANVPGSAICHVEHSEARALLGNCTYIFVLQLKIWRGKWKCGGDGCPPCWPSNWKWIFNVLLISYMTTYFTFKRNWIWWFLKKFVFLVKSKLGPTKFMMMQAVILQCSSMFFLFSMEFYEVWYDFKSIWTHCVSHQGRAFDWRVVGAGWMTHVRRLDNQIYMEQIKKFSAPQHSNDLYNKVIELFNPLNSILCKLSCPIHGFLVQIILRCLLWCYSELKI